MARLNYSSLQCHMILPKLYYSNLLLEKHLLLLLLLSMLKTVNNFKDTLMNRTFKRTVI